MKGKTFLHVKLPNSNLLTFTSVNTKCITAVMMTKDFVHKGDYIRDTEKMQWTLCCKCKINMIL